MCNNYAMRRGQAEILALLAAIDSVGNMPDFPGIFPDMAAPIVRGATGGGHELVLARWGMPSPMFVQKQAAEKRADALRKKGQDVDAERFSALLKAEPDRGVTNVRKTDSPHWRRWLTPEHRCLVPLTSFAEPNQVGGLPGENVWFALNEDRPLTFFAGVEQRAWTGVRKASEGEVTCDLYAFLTTTVAKSQTARTVAANNIVNSGFMVAATLLLSVLIALGLTIDDTLLMVAAMCLLSAWLARKLHKACD